MPCLTSAVYHGAHDPHTDIADGWEREAEEDEYFYRFSLKAYPVGINIVLYAMTH